MGRDNRGRRARGSGRRGSNRRRRAAGKSSALRSRAASNLNDLLGRFSDALSLITVVQRSLSARESARIGDEEVALGHALDELKSVYNELDASTMCIQSAAGEPAAAPRPDERE
jgi:hypothetical protein